MIVPRRPPVVQPASPDVTGNADVPAAGRHSRRAVLGGALAAGLNACGGNTTAPAAGTVSTTTSAGTSAASAPPGVAAPSPPRDTMPAPRSSGQSLAATSQVPVGGGIILAEARLVLTQPEPGTYKAFSATCTHQGCTVGSVADRTITCFCHGSAFSAVDGSVKKGPADKPLPEVGVVVQDGRVHKA